jgi:hypothetical protein
VRKKLGVLYKRGYERRKSKIEKERIKWDWTTDVNRGTEIHHRKLTSPSSSGNIQTR